MKKTIYLAGIIDDNDEKGALEWRAKAYKFLKKYKGVESVLNPLRGRLFNNDKGRTCNEIVDRDIWDVYNADIILAVMNTTKVIKDEEPRIPFGTPCEIAIAHLIRHIPIVFVSDSERLRNHPWVKRFCSKIFENVDDALQYIRDFYIEEE